MKFGMRFEQVSKDVVKGIATIGGKEKHTYYKVKDGKVDRKLTIEEEKKVKDDQ